MKIAVHTAFKLSLAGQPDIGFLVGTHKVTKEVAEHWFTLAHAEVIDGEVEQSNTDLQASILEMQKQIDEQAQALADRDNSIIEMQKQIDEQAQALADRDNSIIEMQKQIDEQAQALADRDNSIIEMQKQIDELTKPKVKANGKEQKPTDTSTVQD